MPGVPRVRASLFRDLPPEVAILSSISFTVALGYGIVAPAIPVFGRQFGVSIAAAASVISAFALMRIVGALPAGKLTDRFGEHRTMAVGIAIVAVSSVLAGFSGTFAELIILRGVGGFGSAMFGVSAQTLLLRSVPARLRGRASGLYTGGFLLGGISGPALGGLIADWSLRAPFFIYGVMLLVPSAIAAVRLHDSGTARPAAHGSGAGPAGGALSGVAAALRNRSYRAAAAANLADGFAVMGVRSAIIPLFVRDVLHEPTTWTGIGFLAVAAVNAATLLPGGKIADTLGRRPVIVAGCLISAGSMVMLALLPGLGGYLASLAVLGLGSGLLDVAPSAMIGDLLGGGRRGAGGEDGTGQGGIVVASYQMAGDVGTVTGPVAVGFLVGAVSYQAAFFLAAAVLGLAALAALAARETRRPGGGGTAGPVAIPETAGAHPHADPA
jgi:MFS family permease